MVKKKPVAPPITDDERMQGLEISLQARRVRADVHARLQARELELEEVLNSKNRFVRADRLRTVLFFYPGVGKRKRDKLIEELGLDPKKRLSQLGSRQKREIVARAKEMRAEVEYRLK